ncbi:hypothetical protein [Alcanivorax hongdengensis]|uniref:hypothetical protein n=1 Tax=Alcanivorax hongdengensis TaxID=519051 RepID=UPI000A032730|nr:hypothetical protein [Alcanivorax hongdengensis]
MIGAMRQVAATVLAFALMLGLCSPLAAHARSGQADDIEGARPGEVAMIADTVLVRPVMFGATIVGAALYTVSLPFSLLGRNAAEAGNVLVVTPARSTFLRCLGCTPGQNKNIR